MATLHVHRRCPQRGRAAKIHIERGTPQLRQNQGSVLLSFQNTFTFVTFSFQLMATTVIKPLLGDLIGLQESLYHIDSLFGNKQPPNISDLDAHVDAADVEQAAAEDEESTKQPCRAFRQNDRSSELVLQGLSSEVQILRSAISLPLQAINSLISMHIM